MSFGQWLTCKLGGVLADNGDVVVWDSARKRAVWGAAGVSQEAIDDAVCVVGGAKSLAVAPWGSTSQLRVWPAANIYHGAGFASYVNNYSMAFKLWSFLT